MESVQARHVTLGNMALQWKADSHPFVGSSSLLNFPLSHAVMVVQVEASEQAVHVVLTTAVIALQSKDNSHPLVGSASPLNLPLEHATAVHVEEDEQEVHVPPATGGHPASHPLLKLPSSLNLLTTQVTAVQVVIRSVQSLQVASVTGIDAQ